MTWIAIPFLIAGGVFGLVGSLGLLRLPTPMMRLHAPTKATTLGVGGVLVAAILRGWRWDTYPVAGILIAGFLLATAPVTAMALARLAIARGAEPVPEGNWTVSPAPPPDS